MRIRAAILVLLLAAPLFLRAADISINTNQPGAVTYCSQAVYLAPDFTMDATFTVTGIKISFSQGYVPGQDVLRVSGYSGPVTATWYSQQGYLTLSGSTSISEYIQAVRKVQYLNGSSTPTISDRTVTFSLDDADYLPDTQHFYRFVNRPGISWYTAKADAESPAMRYHGLQGYLATITSSVENAFIQQKTQGVGWIGASDQGYEGEWRWVTGPEGLEDGTKGRLFWRGKGVEARNNPAVYGPVNGQYHNWNPGTPEPNDVGSGEDYAHITVFRNDPAHSLQWNDLPDGGGNGEYIPAGYLIEYGGLSGDPNVNLSANLTVSVKSVGFADMGSRTFTICQGESVRLNRQDTYASYTWTPAAGLSDPAVSNPLAKPNVSTGYTVRAVNGICSDEARFTVNVNPAPVSLLREVEDICTGARTTLDPGVHTSYLWSSGQQSRTLTTGTAGEYKVRLTAPNGCTTDDSVRVVIHGYPKMDLSQLETVICGTMSANLKISSDKGSYILTNLSNNQIFNGTAVTVPAYGNYPFSALVTDPYGCTSDTLMTLMFHKIPKVDLTIDETKCYGYNLSATYVGDATVSLSRFTWIFGGDTISNNTGQNIEQIPLGVNQTKRDLVLKVTEDGCTGSNLLRDILVIPDLKMSVRNALQCQPVPFEFSSTSTETVVSYDWDWGDGTKGSGKSTDHTYQKDGYYDVSLKVTTNKGCMNSATIEKMVYVAPIPTMGFSIRPETCLNQGKDTLWYQGSAGAEDKYYWDLKGFDPVEIVHTPDTTAGPFVFDLVNKPNTQLSLYVISKYGCKSATGTLAVKRKPVFSFVSDIQDGCAPLAVGFTARPEDPVDQLGYSWDFGDGGKGSGEKTSHTYQVPDRQHDLILHAVSSVTGCSDSILKEKFITVHPDPEAGFTMDHDIVYNDMPRVAFQDSSKGSVNYYWDFGDRTNSREKDPVHSYEVVGRRNVIQTVYNEFDCRDTTSRSVLVAFSRIFAPNAISPNAPKEIDRVFLLSSEGIRTEGYHLTVISRWNDVVFECRDEVKGWDGKMSNGNYAPAGNYVWMLECTDFLGRPHRQSGSLTLVY